MSDHEKIEYEPHGEPTMTVTRDDYEHDYDVYVYEVENEIVPDIIITRTEGDERFQLWGYQGHRGILVHVLTTDHRHPPDYESPDCRKWTVYDDDGFPSMGTAPETPDEVQDLAIKFSDAPVADQTRDI